MNRQVNTPVCRFTTLTEDKYTSKCSQTAQQTIGNISQHLTKNIFRLFGERQSESSSGQSLRRRHRAFFVTVPLIKKTNTRLHDLTTARATSGPTERRCTVERWSLNAQERRLLVPSASVHDAMTVSFPHCIAAAVADFVNISSGGSSA